MECRKSSSKREVHRNTGLPQETKKNLKQPNLPPKRIIKRRNKTQSQHKKENNEHYRGNK